MVKAILSNDQCWIGKELRPNHWYSVTSDVKVVKIETYLPAFEELQKDIEAQLHVVVLKQASAKIIKNLAVELCRGTVTPTYVLDDLAKYGVQKVSKILP